MDFEALKLLLAVAEHGSFTRAGIKLGLTQPTISKRVQMLEGEVGGRLLYRHGRGVRLTEAGVRLEEVARAVFGQLEAVREELDDGQNQPRGWATLGLPPSLGASLAVPLVRSFALRFPKARLRVIEAFSGSLLEMLEAGKVDLGVLYDARLSPTLLVTPLLREHLYLIESTVSPGSEEPADIAELGVGSFVLPNAFNGLRRVIDAVASVSGIRIDVAAEIDSIATLKQIVEDGPERCVLPYGAVFREVSEGKLRARPFKRSGVNALLVCATPLHRPIPRLTKALQVLLAEQVETCVAAGMLTGTIL